MSFFKAFTRAFREVIKLLTLHRELTFEMARRELTDKYAGQVLGLFWAVCHPVFLMGLYVFIFAFVFRQKIGGTVDLPLDYTTYILSGLVAWLCFQETLSKSCTAISSNVALVKEVVFPLEILPVKGVLAALFTQIISLAVLITYVLLSHGSLHWTYLLLPLLLALQFSAMIGSSFILAPIGAYFRDIKDIVQLFCVAGIYLMPIFYLPNWVPPLFKPLLFLNPFSYLIWCYQDALYFGRFEHPFAWLVTSFLSIFVFVNGYRLFRKIKHSLGAIL